MAYDEKLAERLSKVFTGKKEVVEKKMLGGIAFMYKDQMCVGILVKTFLSIYILILSFQGCILQVHNYVNYKFFKNYNTDFSHTHPFLYFFLQTLYCKKDSKYLKHTSIYSFLNRTLTILCYFINMDFNNAGSLRWMDEAKKV